MFKNDFIWGAATASYQIEGGYNQDGKGLNVWDMVCRKKGFVLDGHSGDVACDHYHRYKEDVKIMKELGIKAYRFSLSWARILPNGTGSVNEEGIKFYNNLIDELLKNDIEPFITLFHWDYPFELYIKGGWLNPECSDWFAGYTKIVVERFSDRVKYWMTLNEPQCFIVIGHSSGRHAPGLKLSRSEILLAAHNALLAHGKATQIIRAYSKQAPIVGYAPVGNILTPYDNLEENINAARKEMFKVNNDGIWNNAWWMDPVFLGCYPEQGLKLFESEMPRIKDGDMKIISQPMDFFGANIYNSKAVRKKADGTIAYPERKWGYAKTAIDWSVTPESLYWGPKFFYERYKKPILITENGMSNIDWISLDGKVHDPQRIDFLHRYLKEFKYAADDGIDLMGYFQWSLMDNFEWSEGYTQRFGLVYVDYETQKRTIKDSGFWYKNVIETNGNNL